MLEDAAPCLLCDSTCCDETPPAAVLLLFPDDLEANLSVSHVVCRRCATASDDALRDEGIRWYRAHWLPDLRLLPPFAPAGHA